MEEFFYINAAGSKVGPVNLQDLAYHHVTPETMVWMQGMTQWQKAITVPQIMSAIAQNQPVTPPPFQAQPTPPVQQPQSYLWLGILTTLLCCIPFGIISIIYATKVDNLWACGKFDEAKRSSRTARNWGIAAAVSFIAIFIIYFLILIIATAAGLEIAEELLVY
jgi:hypothetical protein